MPSKSGRRLWAAVIVVVLTVIGVAGHVWLTGAKDSVEQSKAASKAQTCYVRIVYWVRDNPGLSRKQIFKMTLDDFAREGAISADTVAQTRRLNLIFRGYDLEAPASSVLFEWEQRRWWKKTRMVFRSDGNWQTETE